MTLDRAQLLFKLKEFHLLEVYQVGFYCDQIRRSRMSVPAWPTST